MRPGRGCQFLKFRLSATIALGSDRQIDLRSASRPAPGRVTSKSPPSAFSPELLTYFSPVPSPLLLAPGLPTSASPSPEVLPAPSTLLVDFVFLAASPPCSLATSSSGLGPGPSSFWASLGPSPVSSTSVGADFGFVCGSSGSRTSFWPLVVSSGTSLVLRLVEGWFGVSSDVVAVPVDLANSAESLRPVVDLLWLAGPSVVLLGSSNHASAYSHAGPEG